MVAVSCAKSVLGAVRQVPRSLAAPAFAAHARASLARPAAFAAKPPRQAAQRCRLCVQAASSNGTSPNGQGLLIDLRGALNVLSYTVLCAMPPYIVTKQQTVFSNATLFRQESMPSSLELQMTR